MIKLKNFWIPVVLTVLLSMAACTPKEAPAEPAGASEPTAAQSVEEEQPTQAAQAPAVVPENGYCANPYYPVSEGRTWVYRISSQGESSEIRFSSKDVSENGFTHVLTTQEGVSEIQWECGPDGMLTSQFASMNFIPIPNLKIETLEVDGVALPAAESWQIGTSWDTVFKVSASMSVGETPLEGEGTVSISNTIAAVEPVSVPAGSYDNAFRVDSVGSYTISAMGFETTIISNHSSWYVEGVGMVKSASSDPEMAYNMELIALEN